MVWQINGDPNPFNNPGGLALDRQGNLYVVDAHNSRIQKFDSNGHFVTKWGSLGSADGQFGFLGNTFGGVAVDSEGTIYVPDSLNSRIERFGQDGHFLSTLRPTATNSGQFSSPIGVAVDQQGNVFVTDSGVEHVIELDRSGKFVTKWGGNSTFIEPVYLALDAMGNVYVPDLGTGIVQKFDSQGQYIAKWDACGNGQSATMSPIGVALDVQGAIYVMNVYVAEARNNTIDKFSQ